MREYKIVDFTEELGHRYIAEGEYSGEQFREEILSKLIKECITNKEKLKIILDGTSGMPSSFREEAFGGLVRRCGFNAKELEEILEFVSDDKFDLPSKIMEDIKKAKYEGK